MILLLYCIAAEVTTADIRVPPSAMAQVSFLRNFLFQKLKDFNH
jgi:hypothetical protein